MKRQISKVSDLEVHDRPCLYCKDLLPQNSHESRKFCARKYGIHDWCKYRYKKLVEQKRIGGESPVVTLKDDDGIKPSIIVEQLSPNQIELPKDIILVENLQPNIRKKNVSIIANLIKDKKEKVVEISELVKHGYDFNVFDLKLPIPYTDLFYNEIDQYAIIWNTKSTILLTYLTELLWLKSIL